jgi:hypothetical protein
MRSLRRDSVSCHRFYFIKQSRGGEELNRYGQSELSLATSSLLSSSSPLPPDLFLLHNSLLLTGRDLVDLRLLHPSESGEHGLEELVLDGVGFIVIH